MVRDAVLEATIESADVEVLLARLLGVPRTWILAHANTFLTSAQEEQWRAWVARRERGEPVACITGEAAFFGRPFTVDRRVLIPRPATEGLVEAALAFLQDGRDRTEEIDAGIVACCRGWGDIAAARAIVDIGTGSGCIAVTFALERRDLRVIATDISEGALTLARENAQRFITRVEFRQGRGVEPIQDLREPFLIISNPPYVPVSVQLPRDVRDFEPPEALFGGTDGADVVREIVTGARKHPACIGLALECREDQVRWVGSARSTPSS